MEMQSQLQGKMEGSRKDFDHLSLTLDPNQDWCLKSNQIPIKRWYVAWLLSNLSHSHYDIAMMTHTNTSSMGETISSSQSSAYKLASTLINKREFIQKLGSLTLLIKALWSTKMTEICFMFHWIFSIKQIIATKYYWCTIKLRECPNLTQ